MAVIIRCIPSLRFVCTDGVKFETRGAAKTHQVVLNFKVIMDRGPGCYIDALAVDRVKTMQAFDVVFEDAVARELEDV